MESIAEKRAFWWKQWYAKNKEELLAKQRIIRSGEESKKKRRETWAKYYEKNKGRLLERQKVIRTTGEGRSKTRTQQSAYRQKNRELLRVKRREYLERTGNKWRFNYPEHVLARHLVKNAIRSGKLVRQPCWCGGKGEAHHEDYTKPYQIVWLCRQHHAEAHRKSEQICQTPRLVPKQRSSPIP
jgi:hypothetical protein